MIKQRSSQFVGLMMPFIIEFIVAKLSFWNLILFHWDLRLQSTVRRRVKFAVIPKNRNETEMSAIFRQFSYCFGDVKTDFRVRFRLL